MKEPLPEVVNIKLFKEDKLWCASVDEVNEKESFKYEYLGKTPQDALTELLDWLSFVGVV